MENKRLEAYNLNKTKRLKQNDNNIKDSVMSRYNDLSSSLKKSKSGALSHNTPVNINKNHFKSIKK